MNVTEPHGWASHRLDRACAERLADLTDIEFDYIGIGMLHANTELLETIKDALFYYAERIADIQKEVRELDELIKNPTRA